MHRLRLPLISAAAAFLLSASATPDTLKPMRFFEGRTEGIGTVKPILKRPYRSHSVGLGRIEPDGSLLLVQQVKDEGKPPRERRWRIRQIGPHRFSGAMSEASGPVTIDEVGGRFRFRFKMKGNLSVEQWLAPFPGGMSARNSMTVRKLGMTVATADGTIRKVASR